MRYNFYLLASELLLIILFVELVPCQSINSVVATPGRSIVEDGNTTVNCFVGIAAGNRQHYVTGAEMECQGSCANFTLNVNNAPISLFVCDPLALCQSMVGAMPACKKITENMTACCCDESTMCNVRTSLSPTFFSTTMAPSPPQKNISCYVGVDINVVYDVPTPMSSVFHSLGVTLAGGTMNCNGDCANVTLGDMGNLYLCDPIEVCKSLGMNNSCAMIDNLLSGCCCSDSECNSIARPSTTIATSTDSTTTTSGTQPLSAMTTILFFVTTILIRE